MLCKYYCNITVKTRDTSNAYYDISLEGSRNDDNSANLNDPNTHKSMHADYINKNIVYVCHKLLPFFLLYKY